jgi:FkbM family methyltransferase
MNLFELLASVQLEGPRGILQVGASYGQELDMFIINGVKAVVLIEPLSEPFAHIHDICKKIPNFVAVNALCSDVSGEKHTFHIASNGGMSSSMLKPTGHLKEFDYVKFDQKTEIVSSTVDDVVSYLNNNGHAAITSQMDTLYMDVQGAEYKVLLGACRTLRNIRYISMEFIRGDLYEGGESLQTYCSFLEAQGFTLNNLTFNEHHHADALFIRKSILRLR